MKLVILESPYAGDVERNTIYARACLAHMLSLGESPFAAHLLYTQPGVLDDNDPVQRKLGIEAGQAWRAVAAYAVAYEDFGLSIGMLESIRCRLRIPLHFRTLPDSFWPGFLGPRPALTEATNHADQQQ